MNDQADLCVSYYSSVQSESIQWLWYPYIPFGKITVLQGDPGDGKSTMILSIAAAVSKGEKLPDGSRLDGPVPVIYQCSEDGLQDTVKPRLELFQADCRRIAFITETDKALSLEDERIERAIEETGAKLCILDPIQSFLGKDSDMLRADRVRTLMNRLVLTADKYKCAIVLVGHLNKSEGSKKLYRGLGSIDIVAVARSVLQLSCADRHPSIRVLQQIKNNLAEKGAPYAFEFDDAKGLQWIGMIDEECDTGMLADEEEKYHISKLTQAEVLLREWLSGGMMASIEVFQRFRNYSIGDRTIGKAKKELGIVSVKCADGWHWSLPQKHDDTEEAGE